MSSNVVEKQDLRVQRTRKLLQQAFIELLQEQDFNQITVQDITERAMVNRATFYDHYEDKYALLNRYARDTFYQSLHERISPDAGYSSENLRLLLLVICDFVAQFIGNCHPNTQGQLGFLIADWVQQCIREVLLQWFTQSNSASRLSTATPEVLAMTTSWTLFGTAMAWQQQRALNAEAWADQVLPLFLSGLDTYLKQS